MLRYFEPFQTLSGCPSWRFLPLERNLHKVVLGPRITGGVILSRLNVGPQQVPGQLLCALAEEQVRVFGIWFGRTDRKLSTTHSEEQAFTQAVTALRGGQRRLRLLQTHYGWEAGSWRIPLICRLLSGRLARKLAMNWKRGGPGLVLGSRAEPTGRILNCYLGESRGLELANARGLAGLRISLPAINCRYTCATQVK